MLSVGCSLMTTNLVTVRMITAVTMVAGRGKMRWRMKGRRSMRWPRLPRCPMVCIENDGVKKDNLHTIMTCCVDCKLSMFAVFYFAHKSHLLLFSL